MIEIVYQKFGHIKTDTTGADNGHAFTHRLFVVEYLGVIQYFRMIGSFDADPAGGNAAGQDHFVVAARLQQFSGGPGIQF